jgi:ABC-type phosphate/phosphonate transport system substrate-binding protein
MNFLATLPMYDWPETQDANDRLWKALLSSLRDHGLEAPESLSRDMDPMDVWQSSNLVLGQTCGLPYVQLLTPKVSLVGTPAYDIECGAGSYYSVIIVHEESDIYSLADLSGKTLGVNDALSQSGYAAFYYHLRSASFPQKLIGAHHLTGSHRNSITAIASARVDVAAIDAVSWELAKRHEPMSAKLRVLECTEPTPGLPLITAVYKGNDDLSKLRDSVVEAMASLEEDCRDDLLLMGFAPTTDADYRIIQERYASLELAS